MTVVNDILRAGGYENLLVPEEEKHIQERVEGKPTNFMDMVAQEEERIRMPSTTAQETEQPKPPVPFSLSRALTAIPKGVVSGLTTALPEMAGEAMEFTGIAPETGKSIKEWARGKEKEWFGTEEERGAIEDVAFRASQMLGPSIIPGGVLTKGFQVLTRLGKVVKAAKVADDIAKATGTLENIKRAADLADKAQKIAKGTTLAGSVGAGGFFGLSQAQQTMDSAEETAKRHEAAGNLDEAQRVREAAKSVAYGTGLVEAAGETLGTHFLSKLFRLDESGIVKRGVKQTVSDFLKTLGVEVGTEIVQAAGEAGLEKGFGTRPEADPLKEALDVIGPTAFMTIMTGGIAGAMRRKTKEPAPDQEQINRMVQGLNQSVADGRTSIENIRTFREATSDITLQRAIDQFLVEQEAQDKRTRLAQVVNEAVAATPEERKQIVPQLIEIMTEPEQKGKAFPTEKFGLMESKMAPYVSVKKRRAMEEKGAPGMPVLAEKPWRKQIVPEPTIETESIPKTPAFYELTATLRGKLGRLKDENPKIPSAREIEDQEFTAWAQRAANREVSEEELIAAKRVIEREEEDEAFRQFAIKSKIDRSQDILHKYRSVNRQKREAMALAEKLAPLLGEIDSPTIPVRQLEDEEFRQWAIKASNATVSESDAKEAQRLLSKVEEDEQFRQWQIKSQQSLEIPIEPTKPGATQEITPTPEALALEVGKPVPGLPEVKYDGPSTGNLQAFTVTEGIAKDKSFSTNTLNLDEIRAEYEQKVKEGPAKGVEVPGIKAEEIPLKTKEPWEMTLEELNRTGYIAYDTKTKQPIVKVSENINEAMNASEHKRMIAKALSEGKPIPPAVLAEYPELRKREAKAPVVEGKGEKWKWWERGQVPEAIERSLDRIDYANGRFQHDIYRYMNQKERDAVDDWLVRVNHPLASQPGTQENRILVVAKDIVRHRTEPTLKKEEPTKAKPEPKTTLLEQKEYLLEKIDDALKVAPTQEEVPLHRADFIKIKVPGDGTFKVYNTKETLETFKNGVKSRLIRGKIGNLTAPPSPTTDINKSVDLAIEQYGDAQKAADALERHVKILEGQEGGLTKQESNRYGNLVYELKNRAEVTSIPADQKSDRFREVQEKVKTEQYAVENSKELQRKEERRTNAKEAIKNHPLFAELAKLIREHNEAGKWSKEAAEENIKDGDLLNYSGAVFNSMSNKRLTKNNGRIKEIQEKIASDLRIRFNKSERKVYTQGGKYIEKGDYDLSSYWRDIAEEFEPEVTPLSSLVQSVKDEQTLEIESQLSLASGPTRGLSVKAVDYLLTPVRKALPNAPALVTVKDFDALPDEVKEGRLVASLSKDKQDSIKGVHQVVEGKSTIYMVANNFNDTHDLMRTAIHEIVGHQGLREAMSESEAYTDFLDNLYEAKKTDETMIDMVKLYGFDVSTPEGRQKAADEWFAQTVAEKGYKDEGIRKWWYRFVKLFRDWARKAGFRVTLSDAEIADVMNRAWGQMERTRPSRVQGEGQAALFTGEKGAMEKSPLTEAKRLEMEGVDMETIRQKTGWFRVPWKEGKEGGKWRFEIDDSKIEYKRNWQKTPYKRNQMDASLGIPAGKPISDIIEHPQLFEAYPFLKSVTAKIDINPDFKQRIVGDFSAAKGHINVTAIDEASAREGLVHEIQHAIQEHEGFARGGNPENAWKLAQEEIIPQLEKTDQYKDLKSKYDALSTKGEKAQAGFVDSQIVDLIAIAVGKKYGKNAKDAVYKHLAGEYESRKSAERAELTAEERKARPPYKTGEVIAPEDLIVRMEKGEQALSMDIPYDARLNAHAEIQRILAEAKNKSVVDRLEEEREYFESTAFLDEQLETNQKASKSMLSGIRKKLVSYQATDPRVDISKVATWLSQPFYFFKKIPAMWRMYLSGDRRRDNAYAFSEGLIKNPDGTFRTKTLEKLHNDDLKGYETFKSYLVNQDQNRIGYTVTQDPDSGHYLLFAPGRKKDSEPIGRFLGERDTFNSKTGETIEKGAWDEAVRLEGQTRLEKGWTEQQVNALMQFRTAMLDSFDRRIQPWRDVIAKYEAEGWSLPTKTISTDEGPVKVDLKAALAEMGDLRGYYFPRIRQSGKYKLIAKGKGKQTWMNFYDMVLSTPVQEGQEVPILKAGINWGSPVGWKIRELRKQGYSDFKISLSERMPEDVFDLAGQTVAMEQVINKALEDIQPEGIKLSAFGLTTSERKVNKKDPNWKPDEKDRKRPYRDFMIHGPTSKPQSDIFKELGGKFYEEGEKGTPQVWHFQDPGPNFEKRLARRMAVSAGNVDKAMWDLFAGQLSEHIANIYKGRGDRQHMIARSPAVGTEVWVGYDEDPNIALAKYTLGQGASEAKHINAVEMVRAMTGTDIAWARYRDIAAYEGSYDDYLQTVPKGELLDRKDFEKVNMPDQVKENQATVDRIKEIPSEARTEEEQKELEKAQDFLYDSFRAFVKERRIDAAKQPNAFKEAKSYMSDMLRNDELLERVMGFVKGLATLKYLAFRVSAPIVNSTALVTSVPATMNAKLGISIPRAFMFTGQAAKAYVQFLWPNKAGKLYDPDFQKAFEHIKSQGWDKAQFNREALTVLESKMGSVWNSLIEAGMVGFGKTEMLNRAATIAGAYKAIRTTKPEMPFDQAIALAKDVSDTAHAAYFKGNLPGWARKSGLAGNMGRAFYVFKNFSHAYLLNMGQMWGKSLTPQHAKAFAWMALSPMVLAGGGAMVGKEVIAAMAKALGIGGDDPEEEFYAWLYKNTGETGERIGRYGMFGLAGVSIKGSLAIGITDIPTNLIDLLGAPGSMVKDIGDALQLYGRGDTWKATEKVLPNAAANIMRAVRESTEGATTWTNAPVFYGNKPLVGDTVDAMLRGLSFNPTHIAKAKEVQWKERLVEETYREKRTDIYAKFKKYLTQPGYKQTKASYTDLITEVQDYNNRVVSRGLIQKGIPVITADSIRTNLLRAMQPSKKEKLRAANE